MNRVDNDNINLLLCFRVNQGLRVSGSQGHGVTELRRGLESLVLTALSRASKVRHAAYSIVQVTFEPKSYMLLLVQVIDVQTSLHWMASRQPMKELHTI